VTAVSVSGGTTNIIASCGSIEVSIPVTIEKSYSISLGFTGTVTAASVTNKGSYWEMAALQNDPNCNTTPIGLDIRTKSDVTFFIEYQVDLGITDGQIFYARPHASTETNLRFEQTVRFFLIDNRPCIPNLYKKD
jgi:hypothetical protein